MAKFLIVESRDLMEYKESDFAPGPDTNAEILKAVNQTIQGYQFNDFESVVLTDLRGKQKYLYSRDDLKNYKD